MNGPYRPQPHTALLVALAFVIVVADQLSKAWFVYHLGSHKAVGFLTFCQEYFTLWGGWGLHADGVVTRHYFAFKPGEVIWPPHWIQWQLVTNSGAAWSMLAGNSFALSGVSAIMATALAAVWARHFKYNLAMTWALGAIIGGALGNFADRFRLHEVVDFISVQIPLIGRVFPQLGDPYQFPIFNVADSCAVCGTIALALYLIVTDIQHLRKKRQRNPSGSGPGSVTGSGSDTPGPGFSPYEVSDDEKAAKIAALEELSREVHSGEQPLPRSRTDMPLGLGDDEPREEPPLQ